MNIDLASFNINTDQLFQKLVQTRTEIDRVKASQVQLRAELTTANKSVTDNQKALDNLNTRLQGLTRGTQSYNDTLAQRDQAEQRLNDSLLQQATINANYQEQLTQTSLELNRLNNQSRSYQSVLDAQNRATNESIDLYSRQRAELTLLQREQRELGVELAAATRAGNPEEINRLTVAYRNASESAEGLATELRGIDTAGGNFTSNIGNYKSALEDFNTALLSGDTQGLKDSFNAITGSIKGMVTQALAFIATPIGATITVLAGIGLAAKGVFDFNEGIKESNQLLKSLGVSSGDISKVRPELEATAETYGKSFEEIAKTADSLASSYGISVSKANDIIAKGLAQGGAGNEDFLNQISEYDVQFAKLGFTAEESLALINTGFREGVFNDKLPDAIKEVGLSLEEGTKASKDALTNAFGKAFSDNLFKSVENGTLSTKDALVQIGQEADKVGLKSQQQAQLTADVFKGAGEDAGGALKIIDLLTQAQTKGLSETEQAYEDLRIANKRYNDVQSELFEIENFGSVWANIKAQALSFFVDVIDYIVELKNDFQPLIDLVGVALGIAFQIAKTIFGTAFSFIGGRIKEIAILIGGLVSFVSKIFQGDFRGAINVIGETFSKLLANVENTFTKIRNTIIDGLKGILSNMKPILEAVGVDVDKLQKKLDGLKGKVIENKTKSFSEGATSSQDSKKEADKLKADKLKADEDAKKEAEAKAKADKLKAEQDKKNADANNKRLADAQKAKEDAKKKLKDALKAELESAQKLAQEKIDLAKQELATYIEKNKSILENEKFLTKELADQEKQRLENIRKKRLEVLELENKTAKDKIDAQIKTYENGRVLNETEKNEKATLILEKKQLENNYNTEKTKINEETQKGITATDTRYSNERVEAEKMRKAVQFQTELLDLEARGATEQEIKQAQLDQETQLELDKFIEKQDTKFQTKIEKDQEERDIQAEIDLVQQELEAELLAAKDENEKIRVQTQLDALTNLQKTDAKKKKQIDDAVVQTKLEAYSRVFGDIAGLFGKETAAAKVAGIAQAGINTYLGATQALKDPKLVAAYPLNIISAGTIIASGLQSVAKISGIQGFADGGLISDGVSISRSNGDNRLITAKDGEVILNESQQLALGGSNIFKSIGVPGFATGGVVGSPIASLSNIQNQFTNQLNSEALTESIRTAVLEGSAIGTATGSQRGISDLTENNYISSTANF